MKAVKLKEGESLKQLTYNIIQMCLFLKLLASSTDNNRVKLSELYLFFEDAWLLTIPHNGIRVSLQLAVLRYCVLQQVGIDFVVFV